MRKVQEGHTAQLAFLFERYHLELFRFLLRLSGDRAASEDMVQEVFIRILKYANSFDSRLSFPAWIFGMARNVYLDSKRRQGGSQFVDVDVDAVKSGEHMAEERIGHQQDLRFLEKALADMPQDKREVLVLSRFHNLRYEQIAGVLQCEVGTVKVRVYRALKELRMRFSELRGEKLYDV